MSTDELFDDAMSASKGDLANLTKHVNRADELLNELKALAQRQEDINQELTRLKSKDIPEAMAAAGFGDEGFTTRSGRVVKIKKGLSGTWPKKEEPEKVLRAVEFLEKQGVDGEALLKSEIIITYDRGFRDTALETFKRMQKELNSAKSVEFNESVHAQTLSKFLRELKEKGVDLSVEVDGLKADDIFNIFYIHVAEIKEKKGG